MTSEVTRTIASCTIWICTAVILTFGLYRMNGQVEFFVFATLVIMLAAVIGTWLVWRQAQSHYSNVRGFEVMPATPVEKV